MEEASRPGRQKTIDFAPDEADPSRKSLAAEGIDLVKVAAWFQAHVGDIELPLSFERITGGRSNLTFRVRDAAGRRWALRRPPLGDRLASAHDMAREHRIIAALRHTEVPVPSAIGLCEDESVTGAPFYVMEYVDGAVLRSTRDAERLARGERRSIGERVIDTLIAIHAVDPDSVGLGDFGPREEYAARQLRRWHGQWQKSKTRDLTIVDDVHDRLSERIPEQGARTIVHGDYRLDNLILTGAGRIAAVVDWELCTLGDPLADLGLLLVYWSEPGDELVPLSEPATLAPGFPSRERLKTLYAERSGRDLSQFDFYVAFGYWKLAVILEGVFARHVAGQYGGEAGEEFRRFEGIVEGLAKAADAAERRLR